MIENVKAKINYKVLKKTNNYLLLKIKNEINSSSGLSITIGNTLRRVLLNNTIGTAITSVSFNNPKSVMMSSESFKEDLIEIFANLKQLSLRSNKVEVTQAFLKVQGPAIVT